ncbi:MAG: outer membrane beta-barrel protein [Puniceicoccales bacterium]|nr:outer membrane beta-barrel protein [Puniceicoccales bacterium]
MKLKFPLLLLTCGILSVANSLPAFAEKADPFHEAFIYAGPSVLVSTPKHTDNVTYYGAVIGGGFILADHHYLSLELGALYGDDSEWESWHEGRRHYRDIRESFLLPFLFTYNFIVYFDDAHTFSLRVGPTGGMFVAIKTSGTYEYGHDRYDDYYYRDEHVRSKSDVAFSAGANIGFAARLSKRWQLDVSYRFLYASSYEVFDVKTGRNFNHQISLSCVFTF